MRFLERFEHLLAFGIVVVLALFAWKIGVSADVAAAIGIAFTALLIEIAKRSPVPLMLLAVSLGGCSSFMHFSDPSLEDIAADFCGDKAEAHRAELDAEAKRTGVSIADLLLVFKSACLLRIERGAADGDAAGLAAVRAKPSMTGGAQ